MTTPENRTEQSGIGGALFKLFAWGFAGTVMVGSLIPNPGFRLAAVEHAGVVGDFMYGPDDCPKGWYADPADPIRLARAFRKITPGVQEDAQASRAAEADDPIEGADIWLGTLNDEPREVACLIDGKPVLSEEGRDVIGELADADIIVTPMGVVEDLRHS